MPVPTLLVRAFGHKKNASSGSGKNASSHHDDVDMLDSNRDDSDDKRSLIFIDWDDTLFCTSFMSQLPDRCTETILPTFVSVNPGNKSVSAATRREITRLEKVACDLLVMAIELGTVFIVTNSPQTWVEKSAKKYMPSMVPLLKKVSISCARDTFEQEYPDQKMQWKDHAFLKIANDIDMQAFDDLIVIGDSEFEMHAAHVVEAKFPKLHVKTVKLQPHPSAQDLLRELHLVLNNLRAFKETEKSLVITLERQVSGELPLPQYHSDCSGASDSRRLMSL